jgi:hypothetical protein
VRKASCRRLRKGLAHHFPQLLFQRNIGDENRPRASQALHRHHVDEIVLIFEIAVDGALGQAGLGRHLVDAHGENSLRQKEFGGNVKQLFAGARALAARLRRRLALVLGRRLVRLGGF